MSPISDLRWAASHYGLREALARLLTPSVPEGKPFALVRNGEYGRIYNLSTPGANLRVHRGSGDVAGVSWDNGMAASNPSNGVRIKQGLAIARALREAMQFDAQKFNPRGYSWSATSDSRSRLYDRLLRDTAWRAGYRPTMDTRLKQVARGFMRGRPEDGDELNTDTYVRNSMLRNVLEDFGSAAVPIGMGYEALANDWNSHLDDGDAP